MLYRCAYYIKLRKDNFDAAVKTICFMQYTLHLDLKNIKVSKTFCNISTTYMQCHTNEEKKVLAIGKPCNLELIYTYWL